MGFNSSAFMKAQFEPRTAEIKISVLKPWFGEDNPVWVVRGQNASEVARSMEAAGQHKNLDAIVRAILNKEEKISALKREIGVVSDEVPDDIKKRLDQLHTCSISPEIDLPLAVKLAETYPVEFYQLTNEIIRLTGLGMDLKK